PRPVPAREEQRRHQAGERDHVDVLGHLEQAPAHPRVLRVVAGDELLLGLGQVERRAARLRDAAEEEDDKPDELRRGIREEVPLARDDVRQVERAPEDDDAENAERERDLVRDELRARAHRAEDRVLRLRRPAADDEAVDPDRAEREDRDQADRDVRDLAVDPPAVHRPARPPRDEGERGDRGEGGDDRREDVRQLDRRRRRERLLADELDEVGDRLQEAELAGAVRAVAELHPAHQLPLDQRQVGEEAEDDVDDHQSFDEGDPPGLRRGHALTSSRAFSSSTMPPSPSACSIATRAIPLRRRRLTRAGSVIALPFVPTVTRSPVEMFRQAASSTESSSSGCGRWNWSSMTRSTAAPEKSGLYATRRISFLPGFASRSGSGFASIRAGASG